MLLYTAETVHKEYKRIMGTENLLEGGGGPSTVQDTKQSKYSSNREASTAAQYAQGLEFKTQLMYNFFFVCASSRNVYLYMLLRGMLKMYTLFYFPLQEDYVKYQSPRAAEDMYMGSRKIARFEIVRDRDFEFYSSNCCYTPLLSIPFFLSNTGCGRTH
jgi:hypothetical protein